MTKRIFIASRFFAALALFVSGILFPALSDAQYYGRKTVLAVRVKGNQTISAATIIAKIKTKPGGPLSEEIINDDIKRLYALGYFTDVSFDVEDETDGVNVTVIVEEKPVVEEVVFEGNEKITSRRIKKIMKTKQGGMLNYNRLSEDVSEIKAFYERSGFYRAGVKYKLEKDSALNRVKVKMIIDEKSRMRIKRVFIEGNKLIKTKKILELMQTRPAWFFRRGYFDDQMFENDLERMKMYYENEGFLDVVITPRLDYKEEGAIYIRIVIDEGARYGVEKIIVRGETIFPEAEIREKISLKEGEPFNYAALRQDLANIRALYYHKGYMNADIAVDRILRPKRHKLNIVFDVNPGEIVYIGKINIKGNSKTKDVVIRRELRAYPGERFDGDKIRRSKERLYNLGFFEDVFFETVPTRRPDVSDLHVSVKETKTGEFSFGGGYSSVDEFIGFLQVTQKNFDLLNFPYFTGDGQSLIVRAELGTTKSDYDISWTEPWILDYPLSFGFDAYHRTRLRRTHVGYGYKEVRAGGDLRLGKEFLEYYRADLMYRLENVDISDIADEATQDLKDEEGDNWMSTLSLGVQFDSRDNVFTPSRGFVSALSFENTGGLLAGDKDFYKSYFSSKFYYSPINNIVIEFKGRAGLANNYGDTDKVPIYERFYAGGANTIRGYRERKIGPRDPSSSDPIGGEATLVGNIELMFPIYEKVIKGAVFYDIGNVWDEMEDFAQGSYKQGTGVGVRLKTPIGPLKLDWGYPLSDNQGDEKEGRFYFSMSHGF
jgi:outer membrane protein insertion porin family